MIEGWKQEAGRLPDERERSELGGITVIFATLVGTSAEWKRGLRGWNVLKSPFMELIRDEGRIAALLDTILAIGRQRFGRAPSRKQKADLDAITDAARLERMRHRLLTASSWADLLATP